MPRHGLDRWIPGPLLNVWDLLDAPPELRFREPREPRPPVHLHAPVARHRALECTGVARVPTSPGAPGQGQPAEEPSLEVQRWTSPGWVRDEEGSWGWSRVVVAMTVCLPRSLPPLLVTNDPTLDPTQYTHAPELAGVEVESVRHAPWRVFADQPGFAEAVLTPPVRELLRQASRHLRVTLWIDADLAAARGGDAQAAVLATFAAQLLRAEASGALAAWSGPEPAGPPDLEHFPGTDWTLVRPDRQTQLWVLPQFSVAGFPIAVQGTVDGVPFQALRAMTANTDPRIPLWAPLEPWKTPWGVVRVRLAHPVPSQVVIARGRDLAGRGRRVSTEWLDFDDAYTVRAGKAAVGHAVTTPRLMEHLYDHGVGRVQIAGDWISATVRRFVADDIAATAQTLVTARELLPRHEV